MNLVEGISPLWSGMPLPEGTAEGREAGDVPFAEVFRAAADAVRETDAEKVQAEYLLATGQLDNPATLTIAATKAEMSVELLVQLRNKAVEAYSELMRISL